MFPSQRAAARSLALDPGTVSRYESDALTPPLGYLACLMERLLGRLHTLGGAPADLATAQRFLLDQIRRLMRACAERYPHWPAFGSWDAVALCATGYRQARGLIPGGPVFPPGPRPAGRALWPPAIPRDPYYALPDRAAHIAPLRPIFDDPTGPLLLVIDGLGGIGKTAVAAALAQDLVACGCFQGVVGASAKQAVLAGGDIVALEDPVLTFESLLDAIASAVGALGLAGPPPGRQVARDPALPPARPLCDPRR